MRESHRPATERDALLSALLLSADLQALWDVGDRGMPVFAHSLDVALLCLERAAGRTDLDLTVSLIGALIHDVSKHPATLPDERSHSLIMRTVPDVAADISLAALDRAEQECGVRLGPVERGKLRHIVLSHHGVYGKIHPASPEARLVAACDLLSSTRHRLAPIDANDVLPLLGGGYRWPEAAVRLGVGRELIKTRLREACSAEGVRDWVDLLPIWRDRGSVRSGSDERVEQIARARLIVRLAREVPNSLLDRLPDRAGALAAVGGGM